MAGPIDMAGHGLQNLPVPTGDNDPLVKGQVVNNFTTTQPGFVADARTVAVKTAKVTKTELLKWIGYAHLEIFGKCAMLTLEGTLDETKSFIAYEGHTIASVPPEFAPVAKVTISPMFRSKIFCPISVVPTGEIVAQPFQSVTSESQFVANIAWLIK